MPIVIDTQSMLDQFTGLDHDTLNQMLDNIAKGLAVAYAYKLEMLAQQELHQTKRRYINSIRLIDSGRMEGTVLLDYSKDKLVQMIEEGADAFDMKPYFLSSPKVKTGKNGGKYLTIPFRIATPDAVGEADVFAAIMPKEVYNVVKNKPTDIPTSGGGSRSAGLKLSEIPAQFAIKKIRPVINDNNGNELFKAYQHKNSIFEGMVKQNDSVTGQNTYRSFRRVSEKSDPMAFIHPGIAKYNLMSKALGQMDMGTELGNQIDSQLGKLGLL